MHWSAVDAIPYLKNAMLTMMLVVRLVMIITIIMTMGVIMTMILRKDDSKNWSL